MYYTPARWIESNWIKCIEENAILQTNQHITQIRIEIYEIWKVHKLFLHGMYIKQNKSTQPKINQ